MKRFAGYASIAGVVLVAAFLVAAPLLAADSASVSIDEWNKGSCSSGDLASGLITHVDGSATTAYFVLANKSKGTKSEAVNDLSLFPDGTHVLNMLVPSNTDKHDEMLLTAQWKDAGDNVLAEDSVHYYCGGRTGSLPYTGIFLLSSAEQAPYLAVANADGALPCGVFDVNGHGRKYVGVADFPGCTAPVTVMCFNDVGEWTANNVSSVVMQGDYEVDFTSSQHGICALFD